VLQLNVYIPVNPEALTRIKKGSAIVANGQPRDGLVLAYYEGNLYGADNLHRFEEKLLHAAGRLVEKYPTVACSMLEVDQLLKVGTYDYSKQRFQAMPETLSALKEWLKES